MCELLILALNKVSPDPYRDSKLYKRGDVICVQPDGWLWGKQELANPLFRIVKVPGVSLEQASAFLGSEHDVDPTNPSRLLQNRAFRIDLDALPGAAALTDQKRKNPLHKVTLTAVQLLTFKIAKEKLADPNVFE